MPLIKSDNPILYVRGEKLTDSTGGVIFWKGKEIAVEKSLIESFKLLCETFFVFSCTPKACDKQFFLFCQTAFFGIGHYSTTGEKFLRTFNWFFKYVYFTLNRNLLLKLLFKIK